MVPLLLLPLLWGGSLQQRSYVLRVQQSVTVQEGLCVLLPCSLSYPGSSRSFSTKFYTYWYRNGDNTNHPVASNNPRLPGKTETKGRFLLADFRTTNCSLQIRDARRSDSGHYFLQVSRGHPGYLSQDSKYPKKMLHLQVTALTDKPHIHVREPLESGRPTQLACSLPGACEGGRPLTFSWAGAAVDSLNPQILRSSVLTFSPRPQDHGTSLTCQVKREGSRWTTQRTIRLNVSYAPRNLTIGVSFRNNTETFKNLQNTSLTILKGEDLKLFCEADSNPPAELSWFRGSPGLNATPLSSSAILELPRVGPAQEGEGEFTCRAQHPLGSQSVSFSLSVQSSPHSSRAVTEEPLVLTLIRGALMGAGFLLTYVLTWLYYTRCGGPRNRRQSS
ncbi:sialic acid-binding Ig-like lectin 14 [Myotis lucifugus]|uniref:sialic acid-binding Ig-like lectin 14 n=1 Tax=Myotis lucifugus TaxID=59463 RepID=UPI000CCC26A9|nr:sialic acid-binding Ig-like lectin 14 [Myotis lucifugus]